MNTPTRPAAPGELDAVDMPKLAAPKLPSIEGFLEWDRQPIDADLRQCDNCGGEGGKHQDGCAPEDTIPDNEAPECEHCGETDGHDRECPGYEPREREPDEPNGYDDVMCEELERSEWYV